MRLFRHIPAFFKNKYLVAVAVFAAVMLFIDKNDVFTQLSRTKQLKELEKSRDYYNERIALERHELEQLRTNPATLEKYAREKYLMKRDNEDLFVVSENPVKAQ